MAAKLSKGQTIAIKVTITRVHVNDAGTTLVTMRIPGAEAPVTVEAEQLDLA